MKQLYDEMFILWHSGTQDPRAECAGEGLTEKISWGRAYLCGETGRFV